MENRTSNEIKLYQFRNQQGEPISPLTDIKTIVDEKGPIKPRYDYIKEMLYNIIGDAHDPNIKYSWQEVLDIVNRLLIEYGKAPVQLCGELPPLKDRQPNKVYIKYKNLYQTGQYGVRVDMETGTVVRLGDNYGKTLDDFYNILPWAGRRRCHIDNNCNIIDYYGDVGFDTSESGKYHTFVESQLFYYKRVPVKVLNNELVIWEDWISYYPHEGYNVHPAFISNGKIKDKIYIGAYEGYISSVGHLCSIPDVTPTCAKTLEQFKIASKFKSSKFDMMDINQYSAEQMLFLISTASLDSESSIGRCITRTTETTCKNTGQTKNMGSICGKPGGINTLDQSINFFGVENLWGNRIVGLQSTKLDANNKLLIYGNQTNITVPTSAGYITRIAYNTNYDYLYIASSMSSDVSQSIFKDYKYSTGAKAYTDDCMLYMGESQINSCGIFSQQFYSSTHWDTTVRLMYIP